MTDAVAHAGTDDKVRCAVIGDASLTSQCIEVALADGLDIVVVATGDRSVADHAERHGIPVVAADGDLTTLLGDHHFDVLLSIANLRILPASVLAQAATAINFHDGPLPAYAGLNVTSWALLNGETEHGISWHLMTAQVDRGDLVASERFPIAEDETAFSLNARCYEAAIATFPRIVAGLRSGTLTTTLTTTLSTTLSTTDIPDGASRVFRRGQRPAAIIDPAHTAEHTARLIRALSLGHQAPDPMGSVHLLAPAGHLLVTDARALASAGSPTGTLSLDPTGLRLATSSGDLLITALEGVDGRPLPPAVALGQLGFEDGDRLPSPRADLVAAFEAADPELAANEPFWRGRLTGAALAAPTPLASVADDPTATPVRTIERELPSGVDDDTVVAAVVGWIWRLTGAERTSISVVDDTTRSRLEVLAPLTTPPIARFELDASTRVSTLVDEVAAERRLIAERGPFLRDLAARTPSLRGTDHMPHIAVAISSIDRAPAAHAAPGPPLTVEIACDAGSALLRLSARLAAHDLDRIADQVERLVVGSLAAPDARVADLPLIGDHERRLLDDLNATEVSVDGDTTVDRLVAERIERHPDAPAVTAGGATVTYRQLGERIATIAAQLTDAGVRRGDLVGVALRRGADMVATVLATHACGAAYVPLDPGYPTERIGFMISDSGLRVVVVDPGVSTIELPDDVTVVHPGSDTVAPDRPTQDEHGGRDLAYVIYTSGSTGTPKGVMLEHRNVVNFFTAMDGVVDHDPPGTWLAVTSLSFDISVLELLWTLARGFHVVIAPEHRAVTRSTAADGRRAGPPRPLSFSLFYFAAGEETAHDGYRLLLDSARWADRRGFEAVWTPERHFHAFGGAYPNPSVIGAALATATDHLQIRAGSVVAPLHSPARIAEEWAIVDNLSGGRTGISFAGGWQPNDFVLNPGAYATAKERLPEMIDMVQRLWRGESIPMPGHDGVDVDVSTLPRPIQPELPVWLTSAGSPATFERAGTLGTNLLTHLLGQSIEQLAENVARYRAAWRAAGHPGDGQVTLMLHTYLHTDAEEARRTAHEPMKQYLGTAAGLLRNMASAFPTFAGSGKSADEAFASLDDSELDQLLEMAAARYLGSSGLFGTVDDAVELVERCADAGVDEIACLIDFGIDTDVVLESLPLIDTVRQRVEDARDGADDGVTSDHSEAAIDEPLDESFAALVDRHHVTHFQCTPSLATMLVADPSDRRALARVDHVMLGGEALPTALATELRGLLEGRLTNMYGPTETTIWSLVHEIERAPDGSVPIGRPVANNTVHVLDHVGSPLPIGSFGELHIGGAGVARGYLGRDELTADRFVQRRDLGRTYATGDIVRINDDGVIEFAGRTDHQVKIRGHRIELGEIETILDGHPDIVQSVVVARRSELGDPTLVAFIVTQGNVAVDDRSLRDLIASSSPEAYVPGRFVTIDELPLTPNGKTDRTRLEAELAAAPADGGAAAAVVLDDDTERLVAETWTQELHRPVGRDDNFFEIGGNSLLAVAVYRRICDRTGAELALTDVFRHPTVRTFAAHLARHLHGTNGADGGGSDADQTTSAGTDRGARRRNALTRRRSEVAR